MMNGKAEALPPQRELFDIPQDVAYLNCANLSPQLRAVTAAGMEAVQHKQEPWTIRPADWFTHAEELRHTVADLMEADVDGIALVPAVSYGVAIAAQNIPIEKSQEVVLLSEQFPSNVYAWRERANAAGAHIRTVTRQPTDDWTDAVISAITEATCVVAVPHCHWTDGALVDLTRVGERARAVGAALVVDASQSFGAFPIDLAAVQPDFLVSVGYKWQLGPYGLGYLYVDEKWRDAGRPLEASWLTRLGAENFAGLTDYVDELRQGARRFDMGGYPQFIHAPMATAALAQLREWSVARVSCTLGHLTEIIAREAESLDCDVLPACKRGTHMLGIRPPNGIPSALHERLAAERVYVSVRGDSIRVSPHVYNDETDIARFLSVLRACL